MENELKDLTRKTLESTFRVQYRQLVAEKMKVGVMVDRIKEIIKVVPGNLSDESKKEVNGRLRALLVWLDGNSQFQFQKETKNIKPTIKVSYGNLYWLVIGTIFGFFTSNAVHALLKIWGMSQ